MSVINEESIRNEIVTAIILNSNIIEELENL